MSLVTELAYLERCRRTLRERTAERSANVAVRLEAARTGAAEAARVLLQDFGANEVFLFGSAADGVGFSERSDIDLAVSGIEAEHFWAAGAAAERAAGGFELDLVDLEYARSDLAHHVRSVGRRL